MSAISARFFDWVQGATFYSDLHREAVDLALAAVSEMSSPTWVDVGCGPGLLARVVAERGAQVTGIDTDPSMIRTARRHPSPARFEVADAADLPAGSADIISAASLLYGLQHPSTTAATLWAAVRPGGALLLLETTAAMTPDAARRLAHRLPSHRRQALTMWARSRGGRTFDRTSLDAIPPEQQVSMPLLYGLVEAIVAVKLPPS